MPFLKSIFFYIWMDSVAESMQKLQLTKKKKCMEEV